MWLYKDMEKSKYIFFILSLDMYVWRGKYRLQKKIFEKEEINCMTSGKMSNLNDAKSNDSLSS